MKIKFLAVLGLAAVAGLAGCKSDANTSTNANAVVTNTTNTNMTMTTPAAAPTVAARDTTAETAVKAALDKAGMKDVTVEATAAEVTLRGTIPKGKMGEVNRIAQETAKRKVNNLVTEK